MSAERVLARHARMLADIGAGRPVRAELVELITVADKENLVELRPRLRLTLAWVELDGGRFTAAGRQLALARVGASGPELARAACLAGLLRCAQGQHERAMTELSEAVTALQDDQHWLANALVGRGTAGGYLGRFDRADADFRRAAELFDRLGNRVRAAACVHNRGFVALQAGELAVALRRFTEAEAAGLDHRVHPEILIDRAQAMVAAGITGAAQPVLVRAAGLLAGSGRGTKLAEATIAVAQCALRAGQPTLAATTAARAVALLRPQARAGWLALATAVACTARPHAVGAAVEATARECDRHGWWLAGAELRLAGSLWPEVAGRRRSGPAALRALGWLAHARLGSTRRAVLRSCLAGLRTVDRNATALGSWELRAGLARHTVELAQLGLGTALATGRPRTVLRWADRQRTVADQQPARPATPELAAAVAALRTTSRPGRTRQLEHRVRMLELAAGNGSSTARPWTYPELAEQLDQSALISFFIHSGRFWSASFVNNRCRTHSIGPAWEVNELVSSLRLGATLALRGGPATTAATRSATDLDRTLFGPVRRLVGDRPLVLVPAGGLHGLPWASLPSNTGRPVTVAPSVAGWLRARQAIPATGEPAWIAGPGLTHATREARALHATHGGRLLTGRRATASAALAAMAGARLAHLAAHGQFRADVPLLSGLELADGPLFGYEFQRLNPAPGVVVLSACDAGRAAVWPGNEVLGLATALLAGGSSAVLASVLPVPDEQAADLATGLHAGLRAGLSPAAALAAAQAATPNRSEHGRLGFVCFGAG